jgi:hypothetical protein
VQSCGRETLELRKKHGWLPELGGKVMKIKFTHVRLQFFNFNEGILDWDNPATVIHQWRSDMQGSLPEEKLVTLEDSIGDTISAVIDD